MQSGCSAVVNQQCSARHLQSFGIRRRCTYSVLRDTLAIVRFDDMCTNSVSCNTPAIVLSSATLLQCLEFGDVCTTTLVSVWSSATCVCQQFCATLRNQKCGSRDFSLPPKATHFLFLLNTFAIQLPALWRTRINRHFSSNNSFAQLEQKFTMKRTQANLRKNPRFLITRTCHATTSNPFPQLLKLIAEISYTQKITQLLGQDNNF